MPDLEKGDFVYQSDQELFLVVIDQDEDSYNFAVHGWRNIDKERLDEYVDHQSGKLYQQEDITETVQEEGDDETKEHFTKLKQLFAAYTERDFSEDGPHTDFVLDDT